MQILEKSCFSSVESFARFEISFIFFFEVGRFLLFSAYESEILYFSRIFEMPHRITSIVAAIRATSRTERIFMESLAAIGEPEFIYASRASARLPSRGLISYSAKSPKRTVSFDSIACSKSFRIGDKSAKNSTKVLPSIFIFPNF